MRVARWLFVVISLLLSYIFHFLATWFLTPHEVVMCEEKYVHTNESDPDPASRCPPPYSFPLDGDPTTCCRFVDQSFEFDVLVARAGGAAVSAFVFVRTVSRLFFESFLASDPNAKNAATRTRRDTDQRLADTACLAGQLAPAGRPPRPGRTADGLDAAADWQQEQDLEAADPHAAAAPPPRPAATGRRSRVSFAACLCSTTAASCRTSASSKKDEAAPVATGVADPADAGGGGWPHEAGAEDANGLVAYFRRRKKQPAAAPHAVGTRLSRGVSRSGSKRLNVTSCATTVGAVMSDAV